MSASSRATLGSSGGMSSAPPGTILLHVGMRDMVTRALCMGRGVTSAPRRAASRRRIGKGCRCRGSQRGIPGKLLVSVAGVAGEQAALVVEGVGRRVGPDQVPGTVPLVGARRCCDG